MNKAFKIILFPIVIFIPITLDIWDYFVTEWTIWSKMVDNNHVQRDDSNTEDSSTD